MKFIRKKLKSSGNTIIEILVATVVVGVILTALAGSMTNTIQNSAEAQYRETATRLAQDAMEVFRKDKNTESWTTFAATPADTPTDDSSGGGKKRVRCIPTSFTVNTQVASSEINHSQISGCAAQLLNNMNYYRAVSKVTSGSSVKIVVYVYWNVGVLGKERFTSVEQTFFKNP